MRYLYEPLGGERYRPTGLCRTGWNDTDQHGGPPTGLLTRAVVGVELPVPMRPARVTVHLLHPVPLAPLEVSTDVVRAGRQVAVVDAHLHLEDGTRVATARAQCLRVADQPGSVVADDRHLPGPPDAHPPPDAAWRGRWGGGDLERFHLDALVVRSIDRGWEEPGPGAAWFRLDVDVVAGEQPSPLVAFATIADTTNGVTHVLGDRDWTWVNPDLALVVHRLPEGPWIGLGGRSSVGPDGIGVATATAFDRHGAFGSTSLTQLVRPL